MYNNYKINKKVILNYSLLLCIVVAILMLSVGYAAIVATNLTVRGSASAGAQQGIFISNVEYLNNNGADLANSKIISTSGTMLHSNIYLSPTDSASTITYQITIFNNSDALKQFKGVTYGNEYYSNPNIQYRLEGLSVGDTIPLKQGKTFNLTFYYNGAITNNQLDSYLNFNFDYYFEEENEVDISINREGTFVFEGVSPENPIDLANIANITFSLKNGLDKTMTGIRVDVTYITTTGSQQSAKIDLLNEEHVVISSQNGQFRGKQNGTTLSIMFENVNINKNDILHVTFDQGKVTNGRVNTIGVSITPIFAE